MGIVRFVAVVLCGLAATPAFAGNAESGKRLANRWCSGCHSVEKSQEKQNDVPTFAAIAAKHGHDKSWIRAWLMTPHPAMPDMNLTRAEIDDVSAYLETFLSSKAE